MDKANGHRNDDQKEAISLSKVQGISTISELCKHLSADEAERASVADPIAISPLPGSSLTNPSCPNALSSFANHQAPSSQSNKSTFFANPQDAVDVLPKCMEFTWFDILLNLVSIFCYIVDVLSDLVTCYVHYRTKNFVFFYLTLVFIIVPSLITTLISLRWYIVDAKNEDAFHVSRTRWIVRSLFLFFQMGQVMRYIDSLAFGVKYMRKPDVRYYRLMIHEDTDATMLRLFECFLESAPQLLIQLYLIILVPVKTHTLSKTGVLFYVLFPYFSCFISLFSIALALASYYKSLRMSLPNKVNLSMFEMSVQIVWRFAAISSRMLALTLFIISFDYQIVFVFLLHFFVMFLWVYSMNTNFCESSFEEACYDALVAIMFVFCYFNPIDNDTRERYTIFYTVMLLENSLLLFFWYQDCATRSNLPCAYKTELISLYYVCFFLGIVTMIIYYLYCHPSRNIKFFRTEGDLDYNRRRHSYVSRDQQRRVFDESDWATEEQIIEIRRRLAERLSQVDAPDGLSLRDINHIGKVKRVFRQRTIERRT